MIAKDKCDYATRRREASFSVRWIDEHGNCDISHEFKEIWSRVGREFVDARIVQ